MGCGGDDGDDNNSTNSVNNNNTTSANEWRLVKIEEDEGKDGSIDVTSSFSYDANGRLTNSHYSTRSIEGEMVEMAASFNYNAEGQWTTMDVEMTRVGVVVKIEDTFSYGVNGLLTEIRTDIRNDGLIETTTTLYYDNNGKLVKEDEFGESGGLQEVLTYIYDTSGHLAKTQKDTGGDGIIDDETIYTFDGNGNLIKAEGGGSIRHYTWQPGKFSLDKGIPIEWFLS
jgi:hypothetical protein